MIELRASLRELARMPGYVTAVVFSLGTGMAVCVAVFSIVNTLVFTDVPGIEHRATLVRLTWSDGLPLSRADLGVFEQRAAPSLRAVAAQGSLSVVVVLPSGPAMVPAAFVSRDFFGVLGTRAVAGQLLAPSDAGGTAPAAVIGEVLWRSAYDGDPGVVGRTVSVAGHAFTIVGVSPQGFPGLDTVDIGSRDGALPQIFVPLRYAAMWPQATAPAPRSLAMAARLDGTVRLGDARREVAVVGDRLTAGAPNDGRRRALRAFPMGLDLWSAPAESALVVAIYLFVPLGILAIGCGNVINLQMARAHERAGELSVRLALGASGARIARLLTVEIVPMSLAAGGLGWTGARLLLASAESFVPLRFALDGRVLAFTAGTVCLVTIVGGLLPAWLAARDVVANGLRSRDGAPVHTRLRHLLVVAQVTGSVALVALTALVARTLQTHAPTVPSGAASTLVAQVNLAGAHPGEQAPGVFVRTMIDALVHDPAVRAIGIADFFMSGHPVRYRLEHDAVGILRTALGGVVTPGWFDATGAKMLSGRPAATPEEAAVNDAFAARAGPDAAATLGSRLRVAASGGERAVEIVGVFSSASIDPDGRSEPMLLLSMPAVAPPTLALTVRAADTTRARQAILAAAQRFDPALPFARLDTLDVRLGDALRGLREMTILAGALSAIALLLASAGLYALMSYTVRRRTREIGIRIAVGAAPADILGLVGRQGFTLVASGGVLGLLLATPIAILMRSMFYGLSPWSPSIGVPTCAVLFLVSAAAALVPGWRAVRVDPIAVLREP